MIKFYDIDKNYINYLKTIDNKIPNIECSINNKFVCGIVLNINNINYYAPISSRKEIQRTNFPIYNKHNDIIATIRFCFMFPAIASLLVEKNFKLIDGTDRI